MGLKRASTGLPEAVKARAVELRREGLSYRKIATEVGCSLEPVFRACRAAGLVGSASDARAAEADDDETLIELREAAREAAKAIKYVSKAVGRDARDGHVDARALGGLSSALERAHKIARLIVGKPTSHTKSERAEEPKKLTADEELMLRLARGGS